MNQASGPAREQHYRLCAAVVDSSDDAIFTKDLNGIILSWNAASEALYGYAPEEIMGKSVALLEPPECRGEVERILAKLRQGEKVSHFETTRRRKDGTDVEVSVTISPVTDEHGNLFAASTVARDISDRKQMESALKEIEERFRILTETIDSVLWISPPGADRIFYISPAFDRLWQRPRDAFYNGPGALRDTIHPDDRPEFDRLLHRHARGEAYEGHYRVIRPDGSVCWIRDRGLPVLDRNGRPRLMAGFASDITEIKRIQEALVRGEREFATLAEHAPDFIARIDRSLRFQYVNRAVAEITGTRKDELIGECIDVLDHLPPDIVACWRDNLQRVLDRGEETSCEFLIQAVGGDTAIYDWRLVPEIGAGDRVETVLNIARDVTGRWEFEQRLRRTAHDLNERVKELRALYTVASLVQQRQRPVADLLQGTLEALVAAYQYPELTGIRINLDGQDCRTDRYEETPWRQAVEIPGNGHAAAGCIEVFYREERAFLEEERSMLAAIAEMLGHHRQERQAWEARLRAEEALRSSEARFRQVVELIPDTLYRVPLPGQQAEFVSPAIKHLLGFSPSEWQSDPMVWVRQLYEGDRERTLAEKEAALRDAEAYKQEYRIWHKDGRTLRWVEDRHRIERDAQGIPVALFGAMTDITKRKRAAEELQRANAELQQFAYVASHDLRAPLRAVSNLASWLEQDLGPRLAGESRRHLQLLRQRVQLMDALIEGLLAYSRAGGRTHRVEALDSGQLVREVIQMLSVPEGMEIAIAEGMPRLVTDRTKLEQVFANLIGNALKYHHRRRDGHVWISAREEGDFHQFSVADDGPGIPLEYQRKVFQMLQRGPNAEAQEGTGMGLAVFKKLVNGVGGHVELESAPCQGSTFRFTWPKSIQVQAPEAPGDHWP